MEGTESPRKIDDTPGLAVRGAEKGIEGQGRDERWEGRRGKNGINVKGYY